MIILDSFANEKVRKTQLVGSYVQSGQKKITF